MCVYVFWRAGIDSCAYMCIFLTCLSCSYQAPFDRHDWVVDRCGTRMRYVLDFYTGKSPIAGNLAFYIDARPALDNWEGVKMRTTRFLERWVGPVPWFSGSREVPAKTSP